MEFKVKFQLDLDGTTNIEAKLFPINWLEMSSVRPYIIFRFTTRLYIGDTIKHKQPVHFLSPNVSDWSTNRNVLYVHHRKDFDFARDCSMFAEIL